MGKNSTSEGSSDHSSDELLITTNPSVNVNGMSRKGNADSKVSSFSNVSNVSTFSNVGLLQWLHFLQMERYVEDFIDNGYDDLETAKKIGEDDLEAIGVHDLGHRAFLLDAVRVLREQGAAWVYLLEATTASTASGDYSSIGPYGGLGLTGSGFEAGDRASAGSSGIASLPWTDHDASSSGNSTCSSRERERLNNLSNGSGGTKRLTSVEMTPEHQRQGRNATNNARFKQQQPRQPQPQFSQPPLCEDENLIQRVSDLNTMQTGSPYLTSFGKPQRLTSGIRDNLQQCDQQDFMQVCALVKDKLNRENISLAAPPFTTKVRRFSILQTSPIPRQSKAKGLSLRPKKFGIYVQFSLLEAKKAIKVMARVFISKYLYRNRKFKWCV